MSEQVKQKHLSWAVKLICGVILVLIILAISIRYRSQPLLTDSVPLLDSVTIWRVRGPSGDVTYDIDQDELIYLLAETRIRRSGSAFTGFAFAEWTLQFYQSGNRFRSINIALGESHGMMTERGFRTYTFRILNGDEIREALERMVAD